MAECEGWSATVTDQSENRWSLLLSKEGQSSKKRKKSGSQSSHALCESQYTIFTELAHLGDTEMSDRSRSPHPLTMQGNPACTAVLLLGPQKSSESNCLLLLRQLFSANPQSIDALHRHRTVILNLNMTAWCPVFLLTFSILSLDVAVSSITCVVRRNEVKKASASPLGSGCPEHGK